MAIEYRFCQLSLAVLDDLILHSVLYYSSDIIIIRVVDITRLCQR